MRTEDKVAAWFFGAMGYVVCGLVVIGLLGDAFGVLPHTSTMEPAEFLGAVILWPFFFIKYLVLGLWAVLYSGFSLLA